jgi:hypothetical protein
MSLDGLIFASLLVWSLSGLWVYLETRRHWGEHNWILLVIVGPGAWVIAAWTALHLWAIGRNLNRMREDWRR